MPSTSWGEEMNDDDDEDEEEGPWLLLLLRGRCLNSDAVVQSESVVVLFRCRCSELWNGLLLSHFFFFLSMPNESVCRPQVYTLPSAVMATL